LVADLVHTPTKWYYELPFAVCYGQKQISRGHLNKDQKQTPKSKNQIKLVITALASATAAFYSFPTDSVQET
jgi:hypothetical protein